MRKKVFKLVKFLIIILVAILILDAAIVFGFSKIQPQPKQADAIIVLGAAINSPKLYNRSLMGLKLYEQGLAPILVLSGGRVSTEDISEATYMQRVMQQRASKPLNVILEENSHSTFENLKNSKEKKPDAKSIIIVSDSYHLGRAVVTAKALGYEKVYWQGSEGPERNAKEMSYHYIREILAMINYIPKFLFN